ncbi:ParA family protein [Persicobacter psychrovividus]|uniref:Sporulation initiation inhibitor Soj n=1 Tax=Persicobacter psychrovividus TaxID=387638 RepID=A0ABN6LHI8_9BACT|nr:sporulation initiation inhibitor Soj [Persicobacter psychrovividus]
MNYKDVIIQFFEDHPELAVASIEKAAGLSNGRLNRIINQHAAVTPLVIERLRPVFKRYGVELERRAKVVSFFNNKNGVGKTTSVLATAICAASMKKEVLMIDLDPQSNLTSVCKVGDHLGHVFSGKPNCYRYVHSGQNSRTKIDMISCLYHEFWDAIDKMEKDVDFYDRLDTVLDKYRDEYDLILIDNMPGRSKVPKMALVASDYVAIPTRAEEKSFERLRSMLPEIQEVVNLKNPKLKVVSIFTTMYEADNKDHRLLYEANCIALPSMTNIKIPQALTSIDEELGDHNFLRTGKKNSVVRAYMELTVELLNNMGLDVEVPNFINKGKA